MTANITPEAPQVKWCAAFNQQDGTINPPKVERNTWVERLDELNPLCHHEALLLCPKSETEWIVWIPDHGEATLSVDQFCYPVN